MSASDSRPDSRPDTAVRSPLASAPKFSPPSTSNVSPARKPLHSRSDSDNNQFPGPTIRIVDDPGKEIYSKTPFPSDPSQILPARNAPGYAFERRGRDVSEGGTVANAVAKWEAAKTLVPKPSPHSKRPARHSAASTSSTVEEDTLIASSFSPSTFRFSQASTAPSSPSRPSSFVAEKQLEVLEEVPSSPSKSTIRVIAPSASARSEVPPEPQPETPSEAHALTPRASAESSLASSANTPGTQLHHRRSSSNLVVLNDTPSSRGHNHAWSSTSSLIKKQASPDNTPSRRPISQASLAQSLAFSDITSISEQPRPSINEAREVSFTSETPIRYPVVREPSSNSLRAESQELPSISSRMNNRNSQVHQWSSQLSTIHSESERGSRSIGRSSHVFSVQSLSHDDFSNSGRSNIPQTRRPVESIPSDNDSTSATESSVAIPLPLFSPLGVPSHHDGFHDEAGDTITPLQSPPLRTKRSGLSGYARSTRSNSTSRPGSAQSDLSNFVTNTIPGWARYVVIL